MMKSIVIPLASFFCVFALFLSFVCHSTGLITDTGRIITPVIKESPVLYTGKVVVIDAGHGGEDGGAVSASGISEKDINLSLSLILRDMLEADGIKVIMTRTDDRLLYDRNVNFKGRKKVLDLAARLAIGNTGNGIFISIHMNSFPSLITCRGTQVWYSPNNEESPVIAENIRKNVQSLLGQSESRKCKRAGSSIYLLDRITAPAVLVECGFLSNPTEALLLSNPAYQQKLAFVIFSSVCEYLSGDNNS